MALLLDTHILLWAMDTPQRIPAHVRAMLANRGETVYFSAASIWEIAVKSALKKVDFDYRPDDIAETARRTGFTELPVTADHAARVADLPHHHRDPFDRLLIAQALLLPARFLTVDGLLVPYSDLVLLIKPV
jgi:PIN domain nuclease of toxin-antitoxin system